MKSSSCFFYIKHGFGKDLSTGTALFLVVGRTLRVLRSLAMCLDLAKPFDWINHDLLWLTFICTVCAELQEGLDKVVFWEEKVNRGLCYDITSSCKTVNIGVSQGCVLSPTLFFIFINDLMFHIDHAISISLRRLMKSKANLSFSKIPDWVKANRLIIDNNKTSYIFFNTRKYKQ